MLLVVGRVERLRWLFGIPKVLRRIVQDQTGEVGKAPMVLRKELRLGAATIRLLSGRISPDI